MNRLRVLLLTTLILLPASRLLGQDMGYYGQDVACNIGTITFSVAQAFRQHNTFSADTWYFEGWYIVDPGKCTKIGGVGTYHNTLGGLFGKEPVQLLAFAFQDSTGTWGAVKVSEGNGADSGVSFHPSNRQFCVNTNDAFQYSRDSPGGDLPRVCDGAQTGYQMIPASFEYTGPSSESNILDETVDKVFVKLGPNSRAIPMGKQTSSAGASRSSGVAGSSQSNGDASPGLCGKVSCWDYFAQGVRQAEAQRAAANANHNPPPPAPAPPPPSAAPSAPPPSIARVPQRPRVAPIMIGKVDVSHLAGLQRDDTREYISSILGSPASGTDGDVYSQGDGISIKTNSTADSTLDEVTATGKSSIGVADPLLNLLGKSESAAIALLGPPKAQESLWDIDTTDLIWTFPMDGRPTPQYANPGSIQTLTLHFGSGGFITPPNPR